MFADPLPAKHHHYGLFAKTEIIFLWTSLLGQLGKTATIFIAMKQF